MLSTRHLGVCRHLEREVSFWGSSRLVLPMDRAASLLGYCPHSQQRTELPGYYDASLQQDWSGPLVTSRGGSTPVHIISPKNARSQCGGEASRNRTPELIRFNGHSPNVTPKSHPRTPQSSLAITLAVGLRGRICGVSLSSAVPVHPLQAEPV
ncbi:hypothetical protein BC834DRAFT_532939 [Gloeopeniophorella convolvens]|nr:hypothetical protein BC834DRAFT_532939 [Gloeopeniophorella convolvens]